MLSKKRKQKKKFNKEIKDIIRIFESILFKRPYLILFGRLRLENQSKNSKEIINPYLHDINKEFYLGFDIDLDKL